MKYILTMAIKKMFLLLFILPFQIFAQSKIKIDYLSLDICENSIEFTKNIVRNYEIYLLYENQEIKIEKESDSILIAPILTSSQQLFFKGKETVKLKFVNQDHCFITTFPNVFLQISHLEFAFYIADNLKKRKKSKFIINIKKISKKHLAINFLTWGSRMASEIITQCGD